jgi:hypothetical protein
MPVCFRMFLRVLWPLGELSQTLPKMEEDGFLISITILKLLYLKSNCLH